MVDNYKDGGPLAPFFALSSKQGVLRRIRVVPGGLVGMDMRAAPELPPGQKRADHQRQQDQAECGRVHAV
jgi:hypothetical protein